MDLTVQEKQAVKQAAELVTKLNSLFEGDDSLPKTIDRIKAMQQTFKLFEGFDPKKIAEEVDRLKAGQDTLIKTIRTSKSGLYVPGMEDQKFSLLKAIIGVKSGKWAGAEREHEIMKAVREKAAHVIGNDQSAGYFVADQLIPEVIQAIYTKSVLINLQGEGETRVSVLEGLVGGNIKVPKFEGGLIAYWIGEEDDYAESQVDVGDVTMNPRKMGVLVRLSDSMKRFQSLGFENLLRKDMVRAAAKKLDHTIAFGRGTADMPMGIIHQQGIKIFRAETGEVLTQDEAAAVADWQGGELGFDGLMNMNLALEEDDIDLDASASFISAPRFFHRLKQLKTQMFSGQTEKMAYLLDGPFLSDQRLKEVIGDYAKSTQFAADNLPGEDIGGSTTSTDEKHATVIGGNLNNVVLGRWGGIEIEDDGGKGMGFTSDNTYVKLRLYADTCVREPRSLIVCPDALSRD